MLWDNTAGKLLESYANLGRVLERSHKIAGYKVLKDQVNKGELNMSEKEMMQIVQRSCESNVACCKRLIESLLCVR